MTHSRAITRSVGTLHMLGAWIFGTAGAGWRACRRWLRRRSTLRQLGALDERTLRDIGLAPGEPESLVYGGTADRRHRLDWQEQGPR